MSCFCHFNNVLYCPRNLQPHWGQNFTGTKAILTRKNQGIVTVHVALQYTAIAAGSPKIIGSLVNQQALIDRLYISHVIRGTGLRGELVSYFIFRVSYVALLVRFMTIQIFHVQQHVSAVAGTEPTRCQLLFKISLDGGVMTHPQALIDILPPSEV